MFDPHDLGLFLPAGAVASDAAHPHDEPTFDPTCCTGSDAIPVEPKLARAAHPSDSIAIAVALVGAVAQVAPVADR